MGSLIVMHFNMGSLSRVLVEGDRMKVEIIMKMLAIEIVLLRFTTSNQKQRVWLLNERFQFDDSNSFNEFSDVSIAKFEHIFICYRSSHSLRCSSRVILQKPFLCLTKNSSVMRLADKDSIVLLCLTKQWTIIISTT